MKRILQSFLAVLSVLVALVGINLFVDTRLAHIQADFTQQRLYTLSNGTRHILAQLREPITLRLFYSRTLGAAMPMFGTYADRVRETLTEYAAASGGNIRLEFYDPEPFSETEDRATAYGLQGAPIDQAGEQAFFGLAGTNLLDDERVIPFFQPDRERFLEYDLTRVIYELSNPQRATIGLLSSLPLNGDPRALAMRQPSGMPWTIRTQMSQFFTVKDIEPDAQVIDPAIQVLLVVHPQNLPEQTLYAIDQFVMRGGRLMVMVDPHSESQATLAATAGAQASDTSSDLHQLFQAWGVVYDPNNIVGDQTGAWRVRDSSNSRAPVVDYVAWFDIRQNIARDDPSIGDLQQISVASAGFFQPAAGSALDWHPLLRSSDRSAVIPTDRIRQNPDPAAILAGFQPDGQQRTIAVRIRGELHSAFTEPPALPDGTQRPDNFPDHRAQTQGPANLVLVADTDMLADQFWVRVQTYMGQQVATPTSDNGAFVTSILDTLSGGDSLAGLRARSDSIRPFDMVEDIRRNAEAKFRRSERTLQTQLDDAEKRLRELRQGGRDTPSAQAVISTEQRATIDQLRRQVIDTRQQLRGVQLDLRRDIDRLEMRLRLFNTVLVPALLILFALLITIVRARRRANALS